MRRIKVRSRRPDFPLSRVLKEWEDREQERETLVLFREKAGAPPFMMVSTLLLAMLEGAEEMVTNLLRVHSYFPSHLPGDLFSVQKCRTGRTGMRVNWDLGDLFTETFVVVEAIIIRGKVSRLSISGSPQSIKICLNELDHFLRLQRDVEEPETCFDEEASFDELLSYLGR